MTPSMLPLPPGLPARNKTATLRAVVSVLAFAAILSGSLLPAGAQPSRSERKKKKGPPILRAIPFPQLRRAEEKPTNTPNPLEQTPMPIRKALVIDDAPKPKAPPPAPPVDSSSSDQLDYANMVYAYEHYDLAIRQYDKFITDHPRDPGAEEAWYRLGESYLKQSEQTKAENCYRNQLRLFPKGDFAAAGAYRLGALTYAKGDFETSELNFKIAESRSTQREIKLAASFYHARSLDALGRGAESAAIYEAIEKITEDNPYREASRLYLARAAFDSENSTEALERFTSLSANAKSPAIVAEALVKSGLILSESGENEKAAELLNKALAIEEESPWKSIAFYALIQNKYNAGDYETVVNTYKNGFQELPDQSRAKMLLMVGNSYRYLEDFKQAVDTYNLVEKFYSEYVEGQEAGYRKLLCYHDTGDEKLPSHVDSYVRRQRDITPDLTYIDMALMLKAELLFAKADYAGAATAYSEVRAANITPDLRSTRLYKLGWSLTESGDAARAVDTLTDFIILNPSDPLVASALAQRAISYKKLDNKIAAVSDLQRIVSVFPRSDAAEFAWQQLALLHGQNRELEEMIVAFRSLLENFPETKGAAEAWYWIGYAHFELKQYEDAIEPLIKARSLDSGGYQERATLRTILAYFHLQDTENLRREVDLFLDSKPDTSIPTQVLTWLGLDLYSSGDYAGAEQFLTLTTDPKNPGITKGEVWSHLGKARSQLGKFESAITAFDHYLETLNKPSSKARALLDKSVAQLGLKKYDASLETAREALVLEKQGRTNALIRMHLGDIALSRQRYDDAAREYIIISEIFHDPDITPRAMFKAAGALEKAGDQAKADSIREDLGVQFPEFEQE